MKTSIAALTLTVLLVVSGLSQEAYYSVFSYDGFIPDVKISDRTESLQRNIYPRYYGTHSVRADLRWVRANDSALVAFWEEKGDTVLHILTELSGIAWREPAIDINLLRYFPSVGNPSPLVIPVGGIMRGELIEAAPTGNLMRFNLIYQLAGRMLDQTVQPRYGSDYGIAYHPLLRHTPYRRDNLILLLAVATSENILGLDSTRNAYQSSFWKRRSPGFQIFEEYFRDAWVLTPDQTLADQVASVPYGSHLVAVTRPPSRSSPADDRSRQPFVEGLPLKGDLGVSLSIDEGGLLRVDTLDTYRLAYASGLRKDDRIRSVNDYRVRTPRQFVEKVLETLATGGATLQVQRDGELRTVILQPMTTGPENEEQYYLEDPHYPDADTAGAAVPPDPDGY